MCHDIVVAASRSHGPLAEHSIEPAGRLYERDPQGGHAARAQARTGSSSGCALLQQHLGAAQQEPLQVPAGQARSHQAGHDGARPRRSIHQQHRARALQALHEDMALRLCQALVRPGVQTGCRAPGALHPWVSRASAECLALVCR